ncbi:hypothetical protein ACFO3J_32500 [Streptomyces polygonati]|uniref:Uncharacterized protein n=1 Tax=Streptomyces polygonati TaxID=1617087 RepID=A0ABV8I252_9ACTN
MSQVEVSALQSMTAFFAVSTEAFGGWHARTAYLADDVSSARGVPNAGSTA